MNFLKNVYYKISEFNFLVTDVVEDETSAGIKSLKTNSNYPLLGIIPLTILFYGHYPLLSKF